MLLFLGFLQLAEAVDDVKTLTLNACLNHEAVGCYLDWGKECRKMQASATAENVSALIRLAPFSAVRRRLFLLTLPKRVQVFALGWAAICQQLC